MKIKIFTLFVLIQLTELIKAETIHIATGEYPPWTSQDLDHGGYMNLIVEQAFALSGIEVKFDYMPWNRALEATKLGKYPASSFWGHDPKRDEHFLLSDEIQEDPIILFHQKNNPPAHWRTLADLRQFRFGATRGYTYSVDFWALAEQDTLRVSIANDDVENMRKLVFGEIDLFPISEVTGRFLLHKHFSAEDSQTIGSNPQPLNSSKDYLLFSRKWENVNNLIVLFNKNLKQLKDEGLLEEHKQKFMAICCKHSAPNNVGAEIKATPK